MTKENIEKIFGFTQNLSLWFSLGVGLLVMQMGSFLKGGIGTFDAILAIIIGSIIGSLILAWVGKLGHTRGENSAQIIMATFGTNFAKLPILLNIIQLLGWTAFEFVIMSEGLIAILGKSLDAKIDETAARMVFAVFFSGLVIYLLSKPMTGIVRKFISKYALPLVILSLIWLSFQFIRTLDGGFSGFLAQKGDGTMSFAGAIDLVIAMPISWLPLIADYSRFGKNSKAVFNGTFIGYVFANIWCYSLGLIIAASANEDFIGTILLAQGGLIALGFILFDELDNAYGDAYSGSVSLGEFSPILGEKMGGKILVAFAGLAAAFLPMHSLEPFLITLSSVFVPLFAVILGGQKVLSKISWINCLIWILGIVLYQAIAKLAPQIGASLPSFIICFLAAFIAKKTQKQ